jgi:transketolase
MSDDLKAMALRVRRHVIGMATNGGCFLGASLSCADLLVHLYSRVLSISPSTLTDPERDYLLLSKGHDVPALYATLAELGFFPAERLTHHLSAEDHLYWHPNRAIPGVEFHSGSLGHLLSVGIGIALDKRMRGHKGRVFVVLGDGELDEGSVWEAMLVASAYKLDNLVAIVDRNGLQANIQTESLVPLEPLEDKFRAFGANVTTVDGHSFAAMQTCFESLSKHSQKPSVVIALTVRGKGLPSIEGRADRWFCNFKREEIEALLTELEGQGQATLTSETLVVR